jgi:hypothetical protein
MAAGVSCTFVPASNEICQTGRVWFAASSLSSRVRLAGKRLGMVHLPAISSTPDGDDGERAEANSTIQRAAHGMPKSSMLRAPPPRTPARHPRAGRRTGMIRLRTFRSNRPRDAPASAQRFETPELATEVAPGGVPPRSPPARTRILNRVRPPMRGEVWWYHDTAGTGPRPRMDGGFFVGLCWGRADRVPPNREEWTMDDDDSRDANPRERA